MPVYCLIVSPHSGRDPRAAGLLADAHALGFTQFTRIDCADLYFIQGDLEPRERQRLAAELLCDPIAQTYCWRDVAAPATPGVIETALRAGVTDAVAEQIVRAARELGIQGVQQAATGQRYVLHSARPMVTTELDALARRLLANAVIHRYALGVIDAVFPGSASASGQVEIIPVRDLAEDELVALSRERRAALDAREMLAVQSYFRSAGRDPTDVEFETIAQTWSEHCSHKTFKALIQVNGETIDDLLKSYIRAATERIAAPWVRSAFVDNAGIMDFDDEYVVSFKVETHNHPSAIEPFGGANTGTGGVIRDVLGVSAKPIAATDILCFGPSDLDLCQLPEGVLHPRRIRSGVVAGVQDYGNKIGIPTVNGAIWYDEGYTANPLVYCGCVGLAPRDKHPREPRSGDRVIVLGGRTGRDGLRGATFSSMTMDAQTGEVAGASVQIGNPITEKGLIEVTIRARDAGLYHAITDCGAGGLSSAVGEMTRHTGAAVDLACVKLKYAGLAPWEVWLSEAQERMVLAVPPASVAALQALCDTFDVELTDIGAFNASGHLVVEYSGQAVLDLENEWLHEAMPQRSLPAKLPAQVQGTSQSPMPPFSLGPSECGPLLLRLLAHPNIASKGAVIRLYDHEVQGGTVVKPLTGAQDDGPSDACVLKPQGTRGTRGLVLSNGINPEMGKHDPYRMALSVLDEAIRNAVAVGADPERIALLDNFCWGDPLRPETLGGLVEAARGCHDAALYYGTPFISGKDSLNNEYLGTDGLRHAIPPTLLISAMGIIEDIARAVTMDLKSPGDVVYLLGETRPEFGGSHANIVLGRDSDGDTVPGRPESAPALYRALHKAMKEGRVRACHDLSEGGLAVAAAEMCIGGRLGCVLALDADELASALFAESNGRLLVEVRAEDAAAFESHFEGLGRFIARLGEVTQDEALRITNRRQAVIDVPVDALVAAWQGSSGQ